MPSATASTTSPPASTTPGASATPTRTSGAPSASPAASGCATATDWIGVDAYPGTFVPPAMTNPGDALLEAVAQVRECYMPLAGLGHRTPIHLEELGYPTGPRPHRGGSGDCARCVRPHAQSLPRHVRDHQRELVRAARQQQRRAGLPVVLRPAARRLQPEAGLRRVQAADPQARQVTGYPATGRPRCRRGWHSARGLKARGAPSSGNPPTRRRHPAGQPRELTQFLSGGRT